MASLQGNIAASFFQGASLNQPVQSANAESSQMRP